MSEVVDIAAYRRAKLAAKYSYSAPMNFGGLPAHDFKPGDKITISGLRVDQERVVWPHECPYILLDPKPE